MDLKDFKQTKDFADLIGKGFTAKPFLPEEEVTVKWDLDIQTHTIVLSVIKYSLKGKVEGSPISQEGLDAMQRIHSELQYILPVSGQVIKTIQCKFEGVFVLVTIFLALCVGKMKDEKGEDVLPDKTGLIKYLEGFFTKVERA